MALIRAAFIIFGDENWTGGLNYLRNLLTVLVEESGSEIEPVLFYRPGTKPQTLSYVGAPLSTTPIEMSSWGAGFKSKLRKVKNLVLYGCDLDAQQIFLKNEIDVVFQLDEWYGPNFSIPIITWIPDFQHKHLPQMFGPLRLLKREIGYKLLISTSTTVMLSSNSARLDCERFYPASNGKTRVVRFCVDRVKAGPLVVNLGEEYNLPNSFFYAPNQLWRHKNHEILVEAVAMLKDKYPDICIVCSGNMMDRRNKKYVRSLLEAVKSSNLDNNIRFLGLIPYNHVVELMRRSRALINPSLFEGWSTTVEEAKALGKMMILSDIPVHREQVADRALYFDPVDPSSLCEALVKNIEGIDLSLPEERSSFLYSDSRAAFARDLIQVIKASATSTHSSTSASSSP